MTEDLFITKLTILVNKATYAVFDAKTDTAAELALNHFTRATKHLIHDYRGQDIVRCESDIQRFTSLMGEGVATALIAS